MAESQSTRLRANCKDLTGRTFGRLTVRHVAPDRIGVRKAVGWVCDCQCGRTTIVRGCCLKSGDATSCGCYHRERLRAAPLTHGHSRRGARSREYVAWRSMIARCCDPSHDHYGRYGARGITVCAEWLNDFEAFFSHVGPKPGGRYELDRIDNDGRYEPGNVRWATHRAQCRNRSSNVMLTLFGATKCATEWAESYGLPAAVVLKRLRRGWSPEKAITEPLKTHRKSD